MSGFPGYARILGPETLDLAGVRNVSSARDYVIWQSVIILSRGGRPWTPEGTKVRAYINAGRWTADCHYCRKGMFTRPDWAIACCGECGAFYGVGAVIFPPAPELEAAVRVLLQRPNRDSQNWLNPNIDRPFQTVEDLERENREELHLC